MRHGNMGRHGDSCGHGGTWAWKPASGADANRQPITVHGTDRSPMAMPTSPVPVSGMKEGAGRLAQTETLESSGIIAGYWFLVSGL